MEKVVTSPGAQLPAPPRRMQAPGPPLKVSFQTTLPSSQLGLFLLVPPGRGTGGRLILPSLQMRSSRKTYTSEHKFVLIKRLDRYRLFYTVLHLRTMSPLN